MSSEMLYIAALSISVQSYNTQHFRASVYRAKICTSMFLVCNILLASSNTFGVGRIV